MVELDEVDLAKALAMLSKLLARTAADIVIELDSPERTHELAGVLEQAARLLRERAMATPPNIIDSPIVGGAAVPEKHPPGAAIVGPTGTGRPHRHHIELPYDTRLYSSCRRGGLGWFGVVIGDQQGLLITDNHPKPRENPARHPVGEWRQLRLSAVSGITRIQGPGVAESSRR